MTFTVSSKFGSLGVHVTQVLFFFFFVILVVNLRELYFEKVALWKLKVSAIWEVFAPLIEFEIALDKEQRK